MEKKKLKEEIIEILREILQVLKQHKSEKIEKITFNVVEASEYSGIGQLKIRELIDKQNTDFPFFRVGSRALIDKAALDRWLKQVTEEHREL